MRKILLIHGPNLNLLGIREPHLYGHFSLKEIEELTEKELMNKGYQIAVYQSNHEGCLIDFLQKNAKNVLGIIINPGALTHYSYALYDALVDTQLPIIEVHLSNIKKREIWRQHSVIEKACLASIIGKKELGYIEAVNILINHIENHVGIS